MMMMMMGAGTGMGMETGMSFILGFRKLKTLSIRTSFRISLVQDEGWWREAQARTRRMADRDGEECWGGGLGAEEEDGKSGRLKAASSARIDRKLRRQRSFEEAKLLSPTANAYSE
eukprot:562575-Hanusia_phi.AAC.1